MIQAMEATVGVFLGLVGIAVVLYLLICFCCICMQIENFFKE